VYTFFFLALKGRQHTSPGQRPGKTLQWAYPMDGGESRFVYFLNQDYAEEDEEDEFKVFFSCLSGKHA